MGIICDSRVAVRFEGAPMWTKENRGRYDRSRLRYPSDLTDEEWALVEPLIAPAKRGGNKPHGRCARGVNGLMYVLSTGCQWRAIPKDLPPRTCVVRISNRFVRREHQRRFVA